MVTQIDYKQSPSTPWFNPKNVSQYGSDLSYANANPYNKSSQMPIRRMPSKFDQSKLRGIIEVSEGQRPAEPMYPLPFLKGAFIDTSTEDLVVIPKGSVISAVCFDPNNGSERVTDGTNTFSNRSLNPGVSLTSNFDEFFGYPDKDIKGLITVANGGVDAVDRYSQNDVYMNNISASGAAVVASNQADNTLTPIGGGDVANSAYVRPANKPIGITTRDIYADIRGKYLNYQMWEIWGALCRWYIEIPYIPMISTNVAKTYCDAGDLATYNSIKNISGFAYGELKPGQRVVSDVNGKIVGFDKTKHDVDQIIGRVIVTDFRFPKDMLDYVQSYPGSQMPGDQTAGLPDTLFWILGGLAQWNVSGIDSSATAKQLLDNFVKAGKVGVVRILLNM